MTEPNANNNNVDPNAVPNANTQNAPTVNYEDLIRKARQDEKDKLYPEIEKLKAEVEKLVQRNNELLISSATSAESLKVAEKEVTDLKANIEVLKTEGEKNVGKDKTVQDLQLEIQKLQDQLTLKDGEVAKVRTEYEMKEYKSTKLKDLDESVHDLVIGNSKEEIDASTEKAKATFEKIASKFNAPPANNTLNNFNQIPPVNMNNVNQNLKQPTEAEIASMSMADYAIYRKQQGLK